GELDGVEYTEDPVFQFGVPRSCPGVDARLLDPRLRAADPAEYEVRANRLASEFLQDFDVFLPLVPEQVRRMVQSIPLVEAGMDAIDRLEFNF
ncbi:MAG: hypothetical protein D6806_08435, partial [Deltaproteobacteria bacterium]